MLGPRAWDVLCDSNSFPQDVRSNTTGDQWVLSMGDAAGPLESRTAQPQNAHADFILQNSNGQRPQQIWWANIDGKFFLNDRLNSRIVNYIEVFYLTQMSSSPVLRALRLSKPKAGRRFLDFSLFTYVQLFGGALLGPRILMCSAVKNMPQSPCGVVMTSTAYRIIPESCYMTCSIKWSIWRSTSDQGGSLWRFTKL